MLSASDESPFQSSYMDGLPTPERSQRNSLSPATDPGIGHIPLNKAQWSTEYEKIVSEPFQYLVAQPGKDFRRKFLVALNFWFHLDVGILDSIAEIVSLLHNASLIIDDIEDHSDLRRGKPTAHTIYGVPRSLNSANYVYFQAMQRLSKLKSYPAVCDVFSEELVNLHRGQGLELCWRDTFTVPAQDEYMLMISNKTGGLFRLALRLMMAEAPTVKVDLFPLIDSLGSIFQIRDDYLNLCSSQYSEAKGTCEDLTEGKFSFPILHAIHTEQRQQQDLQQKLARSQADHLEQSSPNHQQESQPPSTQGEKTSISAILRSRPTDDATKQYAVFYMNDITRSFEYTRQVLDQLHAQARTQLGDLTPTNPIMDKILDALAI